MNTLIRHTEIRGVEAAWKQLYAGNRLLSPYQDYDFCQVVERYFALSILLRYENVIFEFKNPSGQAILLVPLHLRISNHQTEAYAWGEFSR